MSDLLKAVTEIREHAEYYRTAADYYNGDVGEKFASDIVRRALQDCADDFDINLARRPVDAVLDRMKITAITVANNEALTSQLVDRIWNPNRMERYAKTVNWAALTYGDAYVIAWPGDVEPDEIDLPFPVDLFYNSPVNTRMFYDPEDPRKKHYAAKMWCIGEGDKQQTRVNLYYADRIEKYITREGTKGEQDSDFEAFEVEGEEWPLRNPYGEVPVFHFRTAEPYGKPEHRGAWGPQNAITKLSATLMGTVDFQGFPQRYALMEKGADELLNFDDDDDTAEPGGKSSLKASPGSLWKLPGAAKVGQFAPADVDAFLKPASFYIRAMAASTGKPMRFFDPQGQIPSGEALRADEAPLAARIVDVENWLGEEYAEMLVFASRVIDIPVDDVDIKWAPVQVVNDLEGWRTVQLKLQVGVPFEQAMTEAGYSSELVQQWVAAREAQPDTNEEGAQ